MISGQWILALAKQIPIVMINADEQKVPNNRSGGERYVGKKTERL